MPLKFLKELKKLNFPRDKFAVFGSGCMAIKDLRDNRDIDIIVKKDLWELLAKKYPIDKGRFIHFGNVEVSKDVNFFENKTDEIIDDSEIINGIRFVKLDFLAAWKKLMNREKDIKDIKLIEEYLKNKNGRKIHY